MKPDMFVDFLVMSALFIAGIFGINNMDLIRENSREAAKFFILVFFIFPGIYILKFLFIRYLEPFMHKIFDITAVKYIERKIGPYALKIIPQTSFRKWFKISFYNGEIEGKITERNGKIIHVDIKNNKKIEEKYFAVFFFLSSETIFETLIKRWIKKYNTVTKDKLKRANKYG